MSQDQITRLIAFAQLPKRRGDWKRFCRLHGLTKDSVYHWRTKLGLPRRQWHR